MSPEQARERLRREREWRQERGLWVDKKRRERHLNPELIRAAELGDLKGIQQALAAGADGRWLPEHHRTALMISAWRGSLDCARELLPRSDPNQQDWDGASALMLASGQCDLAMVRLLLPMSDSELTDKHGSRALHWCAMQQQHGLEPERKIQLACLRELLSVCDAGALDLDGRDALSLAAMSGGDHLLPELLARGSALARNPLNGRTALMEAAIAQEIACVRALLPVSDVGARDRKGKTALAHARLYEHHAIAAMIAASESARELSRALPKDPEGTSAKRERAL